MTSSDEQHSQDDAIFLAGILFLMEIAARKLQKIQMETSLSALLSSWMTNMEISFYHLDDAKEIWLAIKARFGGNEESKKIQMSFLKQEFEEFNITEAEGPCLLLGLKSLLFLKQKGGLEYLSFDVLYNKLKSLEFDVKGYAPKPSSLAAAAFVSTASTNNNNDTSSNHSPRYSTSSGYSGNREASSSHGSVVADVLHSFLAESVPKQQLAYEDLKQIEKLDLEELDLKWQMAMLSIRVQKFEKKAGRKIKFNGQEAASFDKKLVQCYKCSQKGHFARECRAKASQDNQRRAYADEGALKIYGMIAGMESDLDSERKATSEYALMGFTIDKEELGFGKPLYSWFNKEGNMHGVPPPMTGNCMPTPVHVDSGCSRSMTGNRHKLENFQEFKVECTIWWRREERYCKVLKNSHELKCA
ncbi:ribonuclease H-like domain-containing protein [Tanacetum coccineum]